MKIVVFLTLLGIFSLIYVFYTFIFDRNTYNLLIEFINKIFEPITEYLLDFIIIV